MKYLEKEHNWDIHIKNDYENDAYSYAKVYEYIEIIKHLENKMFYEKLSKLVNDFVQTKDCKINRLSQKINSVNQLFKKKL